MLGPPLFFLFLVMVYLRTGKRIVDVRGYDDMRRIWKGSLILRIRGEMDFVDLEMNLVDLGMDFVDLGANYVNLEEDFVDLEAEFVGLKVGSGDLELNFMDLETGFVGLGMDFVDSKYLGYFLSWCFGQVEERGQTICYLADP
ncbi:hypothetical protein BC332_03868 [Capsicum chinense]|nr:hypothetical protein BC332_03868 [Capsicum chinense]